MYFLPNIKIIAIDGAAASGKSSTAKALSKRFGFLRVDTGAHYRSLASLLLKKNISHTAGKAIDAFLEKILFDTIISEDEALLSIDARLFSSQELRSSEVNTYVSSYASLPSVRRELKHYQRRLVQVAYDHSFPGLVIEGRDIGSVIFPDTPYKFFLEADAQTRIQRRADEGLEDKVVQRDQLDLKRKTAPLVCPEGAIKIDTTRLDLNAVVDEIAHKIEQKKYSASK